MFKENQPVWAICALVRFGFWWLYTQALGFLMTALLSYIPYVVPRASLRTFSQWIARILECSLCSSHSKGQVFLPLLSIYFLVLSQSLSFRDPLCRPFVLGSSCAVILQGCSVPSSVHLTKLSSVFPLASFLSLQKASLRWGFWLFFFLPGKALPFPFFSLIYCDWFTPWPLTPSAPHSFLFSDDGPAGHWVCENR